MFLKLYKMDFYLKVWRGQSAFQSSNGFASFSWRKPVVMGHCFLFFTVVLPESREMANWKQQMTEKCARISNQATEALENQKRGFRRLWRTDRDFTCFCRNTLVVLHHLKGRWSSYLDKTIPTFPISCLPHLLTNGMPCHSFTFYGTSVRWYNPMWLLRNREDLCKC